MPHTALSSPFARSERPSTATHRALITLIATTLVGASPLAMSISAQAIIEETSARGGVGTHLLIGASGGRLQIDGGEKLDALGARAGLGFGELVQVTAFYWRSADISDRPLIAARAVGGEVQLNLNSGFGLTPFLSAGAARLRLDTVDQSAAIPGAGLLLPLGPLLLRAAVQDYILGVSGLRGSSTADGTTHNLMVSAGITAAFGRGRPRRVVTTVRDARDPAAVVRVSGDTAFVADASSGLRSYQSDRRIEVPLPLEGSITIRYGPDAPPITAASASPTVTRIADPAALVPDPALQNWLRREISVQLAEQSMRQRSVPSGTSLRGTEIDRITDDVLATVLAQMGARDAARTTELREDLRRLLRTELAAARPTESARPQTAPGLASAPEAVRVRDDPADSDRLQPSGGAGVEETPDERQRATLEREARVRVRIAEIAAHHPGLLAAAETDRGPALVFTDAAFTPGTPLLVPAARSAIADVLDVLRLTDATVFVQGHTDAAATELRNQRDSELRAEAVRSLLVQQGLESGRVYAIGYGQGRLLGSSSTGPGRALNRRVEVVIGTRAYSAVGDPR